MDYEYIEPAFRTLVLGNASVETLYTGTRWGEGPVWFGDSGCLLWSDIPNNRMLRWIEGAGVSVFRQPSNNSNGNTRDIEGRLVTCEHLLRRVTRTEHDGAITVIVDSYKGKRLNSPNDVVVKSDGTIWFTDPPYGILSDYEGGRAESELPGCYVFRFDPASGALSVAADDFVKPNGLAFSPDESVLYVSDTGLSHDPHGPHHIRKFSVKDGNRLSDGGIFAEVSPGLADGFRLDERGNLWTSAGDGVQCFTREGRLIGKVKIPEVVSNVAFGGPKKNRLFITGESSLYAVYLACRGNKVR